MSDCSTAAMLPKKQPKTCGGCCRAGTFRCEAPVLYPLGRNRLIYVDSCMVPELQSLWLRGIETGGCCCGHFEKDAFIQVFPEHVEAMRDLGYEDLPPVEVDGELMGRFAFKPKTEFEFRGFIDIQSELEQRYQQLADMAREMYDWCDGVVNRCYTIVPERVDGFRKHLEALGVSVDG